MTDYNELEKAGILRGDPLWIDDHNTRMKLAFPLEIQSEPESHWIRPLSKRFPINNHRRETVKCLVCESLTVNADSLCSDCFYAFVQD